MEKGRVLSVLAILAATGGIVVYLMIKTGPEGYWDYTVQKQQYYVEYSEEYPYWDVLTVEYPELAGTDVELIEQQEPINAKLYDAAMDRVNYWHLKPNDEVKQIQGAYHLFTSDVQCDVPYHSQYLLSVSYREIYSPVYPVWYVFTTERGLTVDLLTGEAYALADILRVDEEFVGLWISKMNEERGGEYIAPEDADILLGWFTGSDEEIAEKYDFAPFFYLTEESVFVVGITLNPKVSALAAYGPVGSTFCTGVTAEELMPYRTDSLFWERYDKSESTGEVWECEEKQENIWLGEQGGVTKYWEER